MEDVCKQEITICVRGDKVMWVQTESGKHYEAYGDYVVKGKWYPADNHTIWSPLERNKKYCDNCYLRQENKRLERVCMRRSISILIVAVLPLLGELIKWIMA
jgi:hypothetical protein